MLKLTTLLAAVSGGAAAGDYVPKGNSSLPVLNQIQTY